MSQPAKTASLIGRDAELAALRDALTAGASAVITGEAGVGKSVLAAAAAASAEGAVVRRVLATRSAATIPFAALAGVLPDELRPNGDLLATLRKATAAFAALSAERPRIIVVDDAPRLDSASATLLLHLVRDGHLHVIATCRTGERAPDAVRALWKDAGASRLDLEPLDAAGVERMAEAILGGPLERRTASWLTELSGGNPLYVRELLASARAAGAVARHQGVWRRDHDAPPARRLLELIDDRIGRLSWDEQRALSLVALAEPVALAAIERLADRAALGELGERGLLAVTQDSGPPMLRTGHPLHGEAIRARLDPLAERALRAELAAILDPADPSTRMLLATWALDDGREIDSAALSRAAADAAARFHPELAARLALAAVRRGAGWDVALVAAAALNTAGRHEEVESLLARYEPGEQSRDGPRDVMYLFLRATALCWHLGRAEDAFALVRRAESWFADPAYAWVAREVQAMLLVSEGRLREGAELGIRVLDADADLDDLVVRGAALAAGYALAGIGRGAEARALLQRSLERTAPNPRSEWPQELEIAFASVGAGDGWDEADAALARRRDAALAEGHDQVATHCEVGLLRLAFVRGDTEAMLRHGSNAAGRLQIHDPRGWEFACLAVLAAATALRGDLETARKTLALAEERWTPNPQALLPFLGARVTVAMLDRRLAKARQIALDALKDAGEDRMRAAELVHLLLRAGAPPEDVLVRLEPLVAAMPGTVADLWLRQATAARDRDGRALVDVADAYVALGARLWAAEAMGEAARAFGDEGRRDACGRARASSARLASACGVRWTPLLGTPADGELSRREREIGLLVAAGLTNAQIARELVLSVRTVESHVYKATTKLGLRSRTELAAALAGEHRTPAA